MMLTTAAVVVGTSVILFDPIFQGLAIALMAGEIASLLLSRMTVPVLYYLFNKHAYRVSSRALRAVWSADAAHGFRAIPVPSAKPISRNTAVRRDAPK
jgi:hypothetical protein